ncbi:MAG: hypothetical protein ABFC71_07540 [Methanoregula sp.]
MVDMRSVSCSLILADAPARFTSPRCFPECPVGRMTPLACRDAPTNNCPLALSTFCSDIDIIHNETTSLTGQSKDVLSNLFTLTASINPDHIIMPDADRGAEKSENGHTEIQSGNAILPLNKN